MKAVPILRQKRTDAKGNLKDIVVWKVEPGLKYPDGVRYRYAFIPKGRPGPAVLYDNHYPKGHHKHLEGKEIPYSYIDDEKLLADFQKDVTDWKRKNES